MPLWSPPRLDLDRAQQRCGRDRNRNASEAKRALHRKLVGDAEQGDVAGKRTPRFRSPLSSAASKRAARPHPPQGRHAHHSLHAIASLPEHQIDRSNLSLPSRGTAAGRRRAGAGEHWDDTASITARVPPTSIKLAWTVRPFCPNCYHFLGPVESFTR